VSEAAFTDEMSLIESRWPALAQESTNTVERDDTHESLGVVASDHRKKTAARGEALKHDIRHMIRMDVNQFVVHEFTHRVRETARFDRVHELLVMNDANQSRRRAHRVGDQLAIMPGRTIERRLPTVARRSRTRAQAVGHESTYHDECLTSNYLDSAAAPAEGSE
jgi:hypothetical protein